MTEQLAANGQDLNPATRWCWVEDFAPVLVSPTRRGQNTPVPGRHGEIRTPNKRYGVTDLVVPLWVLGVNQITGKPPVDTYRQLHDNIDQLMRLFTTPTVTLTYTRDNGYARQAVCEPMLEPVVFERQRSLPAAAQMKVALTILDAFWLDASPVTQNIVGPTGTTQELTEFASASAPMTDLRVTFQGPVNNPQLLHGTKSVQYQGVIPSGRQLVLNTKTWTPSPGTGAAWSPDLRQVSFFPGPPWFELDPSVAPFAVTFNHTGGGSASCSITGPRAYLSP